MTAEVFLTGRTSRFRSGVAGGEDHDHLFLAPVQHRQFARATGEGHESEVGQIVADTKSATIQVIWKLGGWEAKLVAAAAGTKLIGPLQHPYEPWHWRLARS